MRHPSKTLKDLHNSQNPILCFFENEKHPILTSKRPQKYSIRHLEDRVEIDGEEKVLRFTYDLDKKVKFYDQIRARLSVAVLHDFRARHRKSWGT